MGFAYEAGWSEDSLSVMSESLYKLFLWYYSVYEQKRDIHLKFIDNEVVSYILYCSNKKDGCSICPIGQDVIAVDVDGRIYPCQAFIDFPQWSIGDVAEGIDRRKQIMVSSIQEASPCISCVLQKFCRKCPRCNDLISGDPKQTNPPSCKINQELFNNLKWFVSSLYSEKNYRFISEYGGLLSHVGAAWQNWEE